MASSSEYEMQLEMSLNSLNSKDKHLAMVKLGLLKPNGDLDDYDDGKGDEGGGEVDDNDDDDDEHDDDSLNNDYESTSGCSEVSTERPPIKHNVYGAIEGVSVGDWWLTSRECWHAGVHRPPATGALLHCGPLGAYSVTLSDQCSADDVDGGERFTLSTGGTVHTGGETFPPVVNGAVHTAGGDGIKPAGAPQPLSYDTVTLVASMKSRHPVRVVRAHKLASAYAPDIGYRYDGLYEVENYWVATSKEGATVYKFLLQRLGSHRGQTPPPWLVHKIVPPSLHRAVRVKYARALKAAPPQANNMAATKPSRQDTLNTTTTSAKDGHKSRRKAPLLARQWGHEADDQLLHQQQKKQCYDQLLQPKKQCNSYDQLLQQSPTTSSGALRMQASPSRASQPQKTSPKKRNIKRLFENYPFDIMQQQQQQQQQQQRLVLVRNQQLTPEPDPADRFFDDDLSYLSLKRKSYQESVALGQAVSASFEAEFRKVCDELCSELPTLNNSCSESEHAADDNDCYTKLLQLSSATLQEVQKRTCERVSQDGASCSTSYNRLPQGGASCSKTLLQNEVGSSGKPMQNGASYRRNPQGSASCSSSKTSCVSYSRMSQEGAGCSNSYRRLQQGSASCSKTMQSGKTMQNGSGYSRMSLDGASNSYNRMPQSSASCNKPKQGGASYSRMAQEGAGCSSNSYSRPPQGSASKPLQNEGSYRRTIPQGSASCSKTSGGVSYGRGGASYGRGGASKALQNGVSYSRLSQGGVTRNGGKLSKRGRRMSSRGGENFSIRLPQRSSSRMYTGKIVAQQGGENFSKVTQNSEKSTTQREAAANKRLKFSLDNSDGSSGKEPAVRFVVSKNRRKMPRRSSTAAGGGGAAAVGGQKKTSNFDHQVAPPPPVCYKTANDFLNSLVGCPELSSDNKEVATAAETTKTTDETEEKVVEENSVVKEEEERKEEEVVVEEKAEEEEEEVVVIEDAFLGFTAQDLYASKETSTRFADFLFKLCENSDENEWPGWGIVHRRSIIVNGFLIEQVQRDCEEMRREKEENEGKEGEKGNGEERAGSEREKEKEEEEISEDQIIVLSDSD